jgi:hypothetical protein
MKDYQGFLTEMLRIQVERNIILKEMEGILGFDISLSDEEMQKHAIELLQKKLFDDLEREAYMFLTGRERRG